MRRPLRARFHDCLIAALSACLINSPIFALKTLSAPSKPQGQSRQQRNLPPPQQLAEHEPGVLLIKFRPETSLLSDYLLDFFGKDHQSHDDRAVKLMLKDNLDLKTAYFTLRQFDRVIEWVKPNFIAKSSAKTVKRLPLSPTVTAALQSGAPSLDTMRGNQPQPPTAYQPSGSLPPGLWRDAGQEPGQSDLSEG